MTFQRKRIVVAMSGGVDSSVAAALLLEQGHEVIGMTMQIWDYSTFAAANGETFGTCCSLDDVYDARRVAEGLGIPFYVVNFEKDFQKQVIDRFCDDYFAGRTPNPCVLCNQVLKFELLLRRALELEADSLATGHYARIVETDGRHALRKGLDPAKDQSYFLFTLTQEQMAMVRFPLGGMTKEEVRGHAARFGLRVAEKAESQDICFVPDGDYVRFLEEERGPGQLDGEIVHVSGQVLGRHLGTYRYTIGQRRGLPGGFADPLYVIALRPETREVVVGPREALLGTQLSASGVNWLVDAPPRVGDEVQVRIRHRAPLAPAVVDAITDGEVNVTLHTPASAITPGQSAVLYDGTRVLGGGFID
jgi:tRNA-specific 2-thiouridylase